MQTFGGVPDSLIVVAKVFRNAPLLCWLHAVKFPFVHCASEVHGCGGFSNANVKFGSKQKPQKTRASWLLLKEVFVCVPVDRPKSTGRQPMNEPLASPQEGTSWPFGAFGGGQSW